MKNIKQQLHDLNKNPDSLNLLRKINNNIPERNFHEHTHILYDLRTSLGESKKNYVEIGSYVGSSAALMLRHPFETDITCIDPCNLLATHYNGKDDQYHTLSRNLKNNNPYHRNVKIFKNFSYDELPLNELDNIEILHIDGDHSREAVIQDFNLYKDKINIGGFIVFDDYHDRKHSPQVHRAVDYIMSHIDKSQYDIIGCLDNYNQVHKEQNRNVYSNFILQKTL